MFYIWTYMYNKLNSMVNYTPKVLFLGTFILYVTFVQGQTGGNSVPLCNYINQTNLERSAKAIDGVLLEPPSIDNSPYFELESNQTSDVNYDVTLRVENIGENQVQAVVIFAKNSGTNNHLTGVWESLDDGFDGFQCKDGDVVNNIYFNMGGGTHVTEYKARWTPDANSSNIKFWASVRILDSDNQDVFYFGIEVVEEHDEEDGHFSDDLPISIDIIIYCAVAFLATVFVISCGLWCRYEVRKKRKAREDSTPLEEVQIPENPSVGIDNKGKDTTQNINDKTQMEKRPGDNKVNKAGGNKAKVTTSNDGELPQKTASPRKAGRISDALEQEILRDGGSLGHKEGRTELARSHVIMKELIGEGAFGDVYRAQAIGITNEPITNVAVKVLKDSSVADADFKKELKILMTFDPHPNIVQLMGACTEKEPYFLVLEFANVGDLRAFLHKKRSATESKILQPAQIMTFAVQIAEGMEYIESKQCVHRDLATRNILLSSSNNELICKLSDFGLARTVNNKEEYRMESNSRVPVRWMAPECIRDNVYTTKSDVWSFGVVCWELVTMGSHPYGGFKAAQVIKMVLHGQRLEKPDNCSNELYNVIMTSCWQEKYSRRPGFTNLRKQLEVMLLKAEDYISPSKLNSNNYVYLKPGNWDNTDGEAKPKKKRGAKRRTIPNNYEMQFEGRNRRK